jgi:alpha-beta hydrolase superfamily lysophospholipase
MNARVSSPEERAEMAKHLRHLADALDNRGLDAVVVDWKSIGVRAKSIADFVDSIRESGEWYQVPA